MRPRSGLAVLVLLMCGCGSSTAASQPQTSAPSGGGYADCSPPQARTLVADHQASVYRLGKSIYGCLFRGRSYRLGSAGTCVNSDRVGPVALKGAVAAYGVRRCGVDTGTAQVVVRRLADGKVLHTEPAITGRLPPESYQSVTALVVKTDGAVAWIAHGGSIVAHGQDFEVHRADRGGPARLDSSASGSLSSLRLQGSTLTWRHSGRRHSATLS